MRPQKVARPANLPLLRAFWSLLDGLWGILKGSWEVLAAIISLCIWSPRGSYQKHKAPHVEQLNSGQALAGVEGLRLAEAGRGF